MTGSPKLALAGVSASTPFAHFHLSLFLVSSVGSFLLLRLLLPAAKQVSEGIAAQPPARVAVGVCVAVLVGVCVGDLVGVLVGGGMPKNCTAQSAPPWEETAGLAKFVQLGLLDVVLRPLP